MSQESNGYKKRHKEIEIESETLFLLNAAGLENERLFPDVEQILSIDDYYDKLWNRDITVEENLKEVFTFLCTFYGTMFAQQGEMSEAEQRENVERIAEECSSRNAVELMRAFYDLINNNDKAFERITGRTKNENKLNRFKIRIDNLEKALKDSRDEKIGVEQLEPKAKKKFFISYSHEDRKKVHRLVCALTYELHRLEIPVDLYYDEEEFRAGDDWRNKAKTLIRSEDCLGAVLFLSKNSAQSEPVHFEFSKLQECKKRIVCVNGEMEKLSEWLGKMQKQVEKKTSERVSDFCEYYQTSRIFVPFWDKKAKEENLEDCVKTLIEEIRKEYKEHKEKNAQNDMGRVITEPIKQAANLYVALKMGIFNSYDSTGEWDVVFSGENYELNECIYPLVLSLKETRIKRDNVIMFGYEIITKKGDSNFPIRYLLSSKKLDADDYYCIPHCRRVGEKCSWMVDPYLVRDDVFECLRAQK